MSRIYKVVLTSYFVSSPGKIVAIKPAADTFESFTEEIFTRFPEINRERLELFYEDADDDNIMIVVAQDFDIFKKQWIDRVFASISNFDWLSCYAKNKSTTTIQPSQEIGPNSTDHVGLVPTKMGATEESELDVSDSDSCGRPHKRQKTDRNGKRW